MAVKPKPTVLKLNGSKFNLHPPNKHVQTLKAFLDKAPADEIFTTDSVCQKSGLHYNTLRSSSYAEACRQLAEYSARVGKSRYWGNPRAIAALLEQVGAE